MKYGIFTILLLLQTSMAFAIPDFVGTYNCAGYDPYLEKYYKGIIHIKPQNTVYSLEMEYDTGEKAVGTAGLYDNSTISVVFQDIEDPKKIGLERYSYSQNGKVIQGYWVYLGKDKLGKEVCQKITEKK